MVPWQVVEVLGYAPAKAPENSHHHRERNRDRTARDAAQSESRGKPRAQGQSDLPRFAAAKPGGRIVGTFVLEAV